eukprot:4474137-Pleurochrysis_carterae.AAC.1
MLTSQAVVVPYAWIALLVVFASVPSRTDSTFMQLACWRTAFRIEFINSVLAQLHDLHCFAEPLYLSEQLFLRARRLARGHRATFAAVLNSAALDALALINSTVFTVAVPPRPVAWFVDLTFASSLGASDDLVPLFPLLHDLHASLPALSKCHERALQRFLGLSASDSAVDASLLLASAPAYLAATQWQPRHRLYASPDNVLRLANQRLSLAGFGTEKVAPVEELFVREHLSGLLYRYLTLRTILRPNDDELALRSDQVAALVQTFDLPTTVIRRLADSTRLETDASKLASSVPSARDSDGLAGKSVAP